MLACNILVYSRQERFTNTLFLFLFILEFVWVSLICTVDLVCLDSYWLCLVEIQVVILFLFLDFSILHCLERIFHLIDTFNISGDYSAYAKAMAQMEVTQSQDIESERPKPRQVSPPPPAAKPYKPKSFKEMVRLQDPSKLKKRPPSKIPMPNVERLSSVRQEGDTPREHSPEEKGERIYGNCYN